MMVSEDIDVLFDHIKHVLLKVVPLTILGYLYLIIAYALGIRGNMTIDYLTEIARTGIMVSILALLYYLGYASWCLINKLLSLITHEKRSTN